MQQGNDGDNKGVKQINKATMLKEKNNKFF